MCTHNEEEDHDCCDCAFDYGVMDAMDAHYDNEYKNWDQVNSYRDGFSSVRPIPAAR